MFDIVLYFISLFLLILFYKYKDGNGLLTREELQ